MPPPEPYGEVVVTRSHVIVERADPVCLLSVALLRDLRDDVWVNDDRIYVGNTRDGVEVIYQIVGWDTEHRCLIMRRVDDQQDGSTDDAADG